MTKPPPTPLETAIAWRTEGKRIAVATVIETWGSAPRPAGSLLIIDEDGRFEGSVSGGCVEGDVILAGQDAIATGKTQMLEFGISNQMAWERGLACGGHIRIRVEPVTD